MFREPNKQDATLLFLDYPPPLAAALHKTREPSRGILQTLKPKPQNPNELYTKTNPQPSTSRTREPHNTGHVVPLLGSLQLEPGGASDDHNRSRQLEWGLPFGQGLLVQCPLIKEYTSS